MDQDRVPLRDGKSETGDGVWLNECAVHLDDSQRVVIDGEANGGKGTRVDEPDAITVAQKSIK